MKIRDKRILLKIVEEIIVIEELVVNYNKDLFLKDERTMRACAMTLINIGELVKNLTEEIRLENKHIPWKSIAGMRDITAHKYQTLNMGDVWITIIEEIPKVKDKILNLLD